MLRISRYLKTKEDCAGIVDTLNKGGIHNEIQKVKGEGFCVVRFDMNEEDLVEGED